MNQRCGWCGDDPVYVDYHDHEWGVPVRDGRQLWELLTLESFQAGLSWITILRKRDAFRQEFQGFDPVQVALWDDARIARALTNPGIVRHRGKIANTVKTAQLFNQFDSTEAFADYLWSFTGGQVVQNNWPDLSHVPASTPESTAMSKSLHDRGFRFCGPVICYAFMQAAGMVNDHVTTCHRHAPVRALSSA
ncbi:DNA-3-methyladenine glycosylase I [Paracoccus sp. (in: a-proteobacteria)]|uniref:DNA-3-methyladenine glycosylase I n=1 Tax=Paracoccus sp. TaxID=267 RepID=UPI0026DF4B18|nr:DNA-3-methyladenine glycosylase I [Paracoccus sp. (in: a-proteobacteria)]MDO5647321.1 DNA-3-methyladenine glycosylase I [Paracoccus sp. (in: a-proteobacteria)]